MQSPAKAFFRRPLLFLASGLAMGISGCQLLAPGLALPCLGLGLALAAAGLAAWLKYRPAFCCLFFLGCGLLLGLWRVQPLSHRLAEARPFYMGAVRLDGVVAEDYGDKEESGRRALRLKDASVTEFSLDGPQAPQAKAWDGDVRVSYSPLENEKRAGPGDRVRFYGSLRAPDGPMNPGEFDYRAFLLGRGITASMSGREGLSPEILAQGTWLSLWRLAWAARRRMEQGLSSALSPRSADLARGMVLGDTGGLNARDMGVYARTGLVHLISVSGMHLALAIGIILWLGGRLGLPRRGLAWLALALGFFYACICGLPLPCQRSYLLVALALLGQALDLETDMVTSLAFGAGVILLRQPGALFEAGCQLSFMATLCLVTLCPALAKRLPENWPPWLKLGLAATASAEAATIPLVAWHFNVYCWPSFFASAVTAPLMGPIMALGLATACLPCPPLAWPLEGSLRLLDWVTQHLAAAPWSAFSVGRPSILWMALWPLGVLALIFWRRKIPSSLAVAGMLAWLLWPGLPWAHRHAGLSKTWFFSVGQGDSSLTEFEDGKAMLVDAGPLHPDAGSWVLGPALRRLGINRIDWAVVTHPHADHYGGMFWVLDQFKVGMLIHSGEESHTPGWYTLPTLARAKGIPVVNLAAQAPPAGWQGRVEKLSPAPPRLVGTSNDMHNNNVVLRVGGWMLLMGDMQKEGEARLLKSGQIRPCALLKVGHHGSKTSSTKAFLAALQPRYAVIQCGAHNRYRHPSPQTLKNLAALPGLGLFRNDLNGCVFAEHDSSGTRLSAWREATPGGLWQAPPKEPRSIWKSLEKAGLAIPEPRPGGATADE
jgi:competence protein ComEC